MKKLLIIIPVVAIITTCKKDVPETISQQDQQATISMKQAITNAKLYNDSLEYYFDPMIDATPEMVYHCDSMYHHYESQFWHCHNNYTHDNTCDSHHHDSDGMHHHNSGGMNNHGGMCCGGDDNSQMCHSGDEHSAMNSLNDVHVPLDTTWDKSSISVAGECVNDSAVCFTITNTGKPGEGDMEGPSEWRLYEDGVLTQIGNFQLTGGSFRQLCFLANGKTLHLETDQRPGHPGNSQPNAVVEQCG